MEVFVGHEEETRKLISTKEDGVAELQILLKKTPSEQIEQIANLQDAIRLERMGIELLRWSIRDVG
jgi:hypothetical protein